MPKIVDHAVRRAELAKRSISVFREHGYHGIGMRKIAEELGVPKSTLYHYFPSKHDLFMACTEALELDVANPSDAPIDALVALVSRLEADFSGELRLMVDYMGSRSGSEVTDDPALQLYRNRIDAVLANIVGEKQVPSVRVVLYGILLDRWLSGECGSADATRPVFEFALGSAANSNSV